MNIFGYRITIAKVDRPDVGSLPVFFLSRRKLARKVLAYLDENSTVDRARWEKIERIKAVRYLMGLQVGLVEAKNWIEIAFKENGAGGVA